MSGGTHRQQPGDTGDPTKGGLSAGSAEIVTDIQG